MLSSLVKQPRDVARSLDLVGARVILTGFREPSGGDLLRELGERSAHLVLQGEDCSIAVALYGEGNGDVAVEDGAFQSSMGAVRFTQKSAERLGGLDVLVNFIHVDVATSNITGEADEIEDFVHDCLLSASLTTRVAANRMRVLRCEGSIINVLIVPPRSEREAVVGDFVRAALATMTRHEAAHWAGTGIRVNAIASAGDEEGGVAPSSADIAELILRLANPSSENLSGLMFDPRGVSTLCC